MSKYESQTESIEEGVHSPLLGHELLNASEHELNMAGLRLLFGSDDPEFIHGLYKNLRPGVSRRISPDDLVDVLIDNRVVKTIPFMYAIMRIINPEHDTIHRTQSTNNYDRMTAKFCAYTKCADKETYYGANLIGRLNLHHRDTRFRAENSYFGSEFMRKSLELHCQNMNMSLSIKMTQLNFGDILVDESIIELYRLLLNLSHERILFFTMPGI